MKKNLGDTDRVVRVLMAIVLCFLNFTGVVTGTAGTVILAAGSIFLLTSMFAFCPLYTAFHISTVKNQ